MKYYPVIKSRDPVLLYWVLVSVPCEGVVSRVLIRGRDLCRDVCLLQPLQGWVLWQHSRQPMPRFSYSASCSCTFSITISLWPIKCCGLQPQQTVAASANKAAQSSLISSLLLSEAVLSPSRYGAQWLIWPKSWPI